ILVVSTAAVALTLRLLRRRNLDRWLGTYVLQTPRRRWPRLDEPVHLLLCVADHYEPMLGDVPPRVAQGRVHNWLRDYPRLFDGFRDSDGRPPRHSFFYPIEQYTPHYLDALAGLCAAGYGDVEVHLHHDHDTSDALRERLLEFKEVLSGR